MVVTNKSTGDPSNIQKKWQGNETLNRKKALENQPEDTKEQKSEEEQLIEKILFYQT